MLMAEIVRCHRAVRQGAERCGRGARAPHVFSDRDEFHLGRDDALPRVPELRDGMGFRAKRTARPAVAPYLSIGRWALGVGRSAFPLRGTDRQSTRLNSSHGYTSYAVAC